MGLGRAWSRLSPLPKETDSLKAQQHESHDFDAWGFCTNCLARKESYSAERHCPQEPEDAKEARERYEWERLEAARLRYEYLKAKFGTEGGSAATDPGPPQPRSKREPK